MPLLAQCSTRARPAPSRGAHLRGPISDLVVRGPIGRQPRIEANFASAGYRPLWAGPRALTASREEQLPSGSERLIRKPCPEPCPQLGRFDPRQRSQTVLNLALQSQTERLGANS